jgi:hypothetical protein
VTMEGWIGGGGDEDGGAGELAVGTMDVGRNELEVRKISGPVDCTLPVQSQSNG